MSFLEFVVDGTFQGTFLGLEGLDLETVISMFMHATYPYLTMCNVAVL